MIGFSQAMLLASVPSNHLIACICWNQLCISGHAATYMTAHVDKDTDQDIISESGSKSAQCVHMVKSDGKLSAHMTELCILDGACEAVQATGRT